MGLFGNIIRLPGEIVGGVVDEVEETLEDLFG